MSYQDQRGVAGEGEEEGRFSALVFVVDAEAWGVLGGGPVGVGCGVWRREV